MLKIKQCAEDILEEWDEYTSEELNRDSKLYKRIESLIKCALDMENERNYYRNLVIDLKSGIDIT